MAKPLKGSAYYLEGVGYAWASLNMHGVQRRRGWLDKAADQCAKECRVPRCWSLINGIKAGTHRSVRKMPTYWDMGEEA